MPKESYIVSKSKKSIQKAKDLLRKKKSSRLPLPNEMIYEILKHLPLKEQQKFRRVSKQFEESIPSIFIDEWSREDLEGEWIEAIYESLIFFFPNLYEDLKNDGKKLKIYHLSPHKNIRSRIVVDNDVDPFTIQITNASGTYPETLVHKDILQEVSRVWKQEIFRMTPYYSFDEIFVFISSPNFGVGGPNFQEVMVENLNSILEIVQNMKMLILNKLVNPNYEWPIPQEISDETKLELRQMMNRTVQKIYDEYSRYVKGKGLTSSEKMEYLIVLFNELI
jgi:hypothetical protein